MKKIIVAIFSVALVSGPSNADGNRVMKEDRDRVSYSLGYQIGVDFRQQNMDIDPDALLKGVEDSLADAEPQISREEMSKTLLDMKDRIEADQRQQKLAAVEGYRGEGRQWLADNATKEGVVALPSGLQYRVITAGSGRSPGPDDTVTVHYRGTTLEGAEFYNSRRGEGKPARFHVGSVIRGMSEGLKLMKEGGRWQFFVPADLAYGERGPVGEQAVIFDVELVSVEPSP
ncbi:MAG: FKBP-type peptidyl-prolyl cis-trans isomerase [bacterium]|nr:FKBP-type peptidyl-prolyl cis-trans isomerase [bacterium]